MKGIETRHLEIKVESVFAAADSSFEYSVPILRLTEFYFSFKRFSIILPLGKRKCALLAVLCESHTFQFQNIQVNGKCAFE